MVVGEFLFLVTKNLKSRRLDLLSNHEICFQNFSFSSRNWRKLQISRFFLQKFSFSSRTRKQISTFLFSLLEIRDMDSIFLFLFSISLFGISLCIVKIQEKYLDVKSPLSKRVDPSDRQKPVSHLATH